ETVPHSRNRILEGLAGQRRPTFKVTVNSALLQSGDAHELGHGSAQIAARIEKSRRADHDALAAGLAFFHPDLSTKETVRSLTTRPAGGGARRERSGVPTCRGDGSRRHASHGAQARDPKVLKDWFDSWKGPIGYAPVRGQFLNDTHHAGGKYVGRCGQDARQFHPQEALSVSH